MSLKKKLREAHRRRDETPDEGHLDETITNLTVRTSTSLKRHWKAVTVVVVLACVGVVGLQLANAFANRRETRLRDRLVRWTSAEDDAPLDLAAIRSLVDDARDARAEKEILKKTVSYLLSEAERLEERETGTEEESDPNAPSREDIFAAVESIVAEGRERFPSDADIARWASNIEKKLETERDRSWLPRPRDYGIQPPIAGSGSDTASGDTGARSGEEERTEASSGETSASGDAKTPSEEKDGAPAGEPEARIGGESSDR